MFTTARRACPWHGGAGALWDIWSTQSKSVLREYLEGHVREFRGDDGKQLTPEKVRTCLGVLSPRGSTRGFARVSRAGRQHPGMGGYRHVHAFARGSDNNAQQHLQVRDVIFDIKIMVGSKHLEIMAKDSNPIQPWRFEQYQDEAVFIPGGCPHQVGRGGRMGGPCDPSPLLSSPSCLVFVVLSQVRNLRSCIKVAVDFVSTDSLRPCQEMVERLRHICIKNKDGLAADHPGVRPFHDKLQVGDRLFMGRCPQLPDSLRLPASCCLLPAACCLLPAACCLLPAACCLGAGIGVGASWCSTRLFSVCL